MPRTHYLPANYVHYKWDIGNEPVITIDSADTVVFWTRGSCPRRGHSVPDSFVHRLVGAGHVDLRLDWGHRYLSTAGELNDVVGELTSWCNEHQIAAARLTGVGGFSSATVAWFDPEARQYREIAVSGQVELLALNGDVAEQDGRAVIHAHLVLGTRDGTTRGAHLIAAHVRPTLELIVDQVPVHLRRRYRPELGLALLSLED